MSSDLESDDNESSLKTQYLSIVEDLPKLTDYRAKLLKQLKEDIPRCDVMIDIYKKQKNVLESKLLLSANYSLVFQYTTDLLHKVCAAGNLLGLDRTFLNTCLAFMNSNLPEQTTKSLQTYIENLDKLMQTLNSVTSNETQMYNFLQDFINKEKTKVQSILQTKSRSSIEDIHASLTNLTLWHRLNHLIDHVERNSPASTSP